MGTCRGKCHGGGVNVDQMLDSVYIYVFVKPSVHVGTLCESIPQSELPARGTSPSRRARYISSAPPRRGLVDISLAKCAARHVHTRRVARIEGSTCSPRQPHWGRHRASRVEARAVDSALIAASWSTT
ncbi:hypothetical protein B0H10DRAFT_2443345 [Mycena sp. CBHHK59/15]|nr:hypothetical protein B0H10DRAFT_2443345 [Mycena sp. CBHHK59/15]